ncbi:MAG: hypothetical protein WDN08_12960 [Rhizomicrobium sp.]
MSWWVRLLASTPSIVPSPETLRVSASPQDGGEETTAHSCGTCEQTRCFRHEHAPAPAGRTAYLVDENWPELRAYVARGARRRRRAGAAAGRGALAAGRYAWETDGFARVVPATAAALARSLRLRVAADGPARRAAELRSAEALARRLAQALTPEVTEVVVAQSLLPFLWRDGQNAAAAAYPERRTLADFRADAALVAAETEALAAADGIVTPHAEIAALFWRACGAARLGKAEGVGCAMRAIVPKRIAFVGPTIARKGAYEVARGRRGRSI